MKLCCRHFSYAYEVADYVNGKHMRRENIQEIITTSGGSYFLFYWE